MASLDPQDALWRATGVVPVVIVDNSSDAVPLARALVAAGLPIIEVTLRTDAALEAIERIAGEVPDAQVGAGTLRSPQDVERCRKAGAQFLVAPGVTPALLAEGASSSLPFLPGTATASEAMRAAEAGLRVVKFFPASVVGGAPALKALASPLADITFVPTGGITIETAPTYLALPNVLALGGSWMVKTEWIKAGAFDKVEDAARAAAMLRS